MNKSAAERRNETVKVQALIDREGAALRDAVNDSRECVAGLTARLEGTRLALHSLDIDDQVKAMAAFIRLLPDSDVTILAMAARIKLVDVLAASELSMIDGDTP